MPMPDAGSKSFKATPLSGGWWVLDRELEITRAFGIGPVENPRLVRVGQHVRIVSRGEKLFLEVR